jgi:hypothetical protein
MRCLRAVVNGVLRDHDLEVECTSIHYGRTHATASGATCDHERIDALSNKVLVQGERVLSSKMEPRLAVLASLDHRAALLDCPRWVIRKRERSTSGATTQLT